MGEWLGGVYLAAAAAPQAAGDTISGLSLAGIIAAVAAVFAAISAWAAWRAASAARDRVEHQKAATLYDIIVAEYLDRDFELTENKETIGGKHPRNLREAKNRSLREYYRDPEQWREVSKYDRGIWERDEFRRQNALAFEVSVALERLGAAVLVGHVPVRAFLAIAADQVLEDWLLCDSWIESYRTDKKTTSAKGVAFHRRHAEWLVLLATIWMSREHRDYEPIRPVAVTLGGLDRLAERFSLYSKEDRKLMPRSTRRDIRTLIGVSV